MTPRASQTRSRDITATRPSPREPATTGTGNTKPSGIKLNGMISQSTPPPSGQKIAENSKQTISAPVCDVPRRARQPTPEEEMTL